MHTRTGKRSPSARALAEFLRDNRIGPVAAGRDLGVRHPTVIMWCDGRRRPTRENRENIAAWTGGAVPVDGWGADPTRPMVSPFKPGAA